MSELIALSASPFALWLIASWLACALVTAFVAGEKSRCAICWFLAGVLLGPLALLVAAALPDRNKAKSQDQALAGQEAASQSRKGVAGKPSPLVAFGIIVAIVLIYAIYEHFR
uniref:hypothetical protein n=1 Tax=Castellaniella defragrans TaxID=75697 RepID=UPI00333EA11B